MASVLRTVRWQPTPPVGFISGPALTWPNKHSPESLDFSLDISDFLADAGFDTISTAVVTATPAGLTLASATNTRGIITSVISGGAAGQTYLIKVTVVTGNALTAEFDVSLTVN